MLRLILLAVAAMYLCSSCQSKQPKKVYKFYVKCQAGSNLSDISSVIYCDSFISISGSHVIIFQEGRKMDVFANNLVVGNEAGE